MELEAEPKALRVLETHPFSPPDSTVSVPQRVGSLQLQIGILQCREPGATIGPESWQ